MPREGWGKLHPGTHVRVEHTEPWPYPEGILIAYVSRDGWASVDLGTGPTGGVRHVPYASITKLEVWTTRS